MNDDTDDDGVSDGDEVLGGTDPLDRADKIPVKWVTVTGDLGMGVEKQISETVTIPANTAAMVCVFVHSEEYPTFTGEASIYNDVVTWNVSAQGNATLSGLLFVNNEDGAWDAAAANGQVLDDYDPVVLKAAAVYKAGASDLQVSVALSATNVSDGRLPSTVLVGVFPLNVVQANMPQGVGVGGTTDGGVSYVREAIAESGVAYITAQPAPPQLFANFKDLPGWIRVRWSLALGSERGELRVSGIDDRAIAPVEISGFSDFAITSDLHNEIVGGLCAVTMQLAWPLTTASAVYSFSIRGKNPLDVAARAYIDSNVDEDFRGYAWMIAKHESMSGGRVYNQFNPSGQHSEKPNWGYPHGWGMAQIDRGANGDTTAEVYDWHVNIQSMNQILRQKRERYNEIIQMYRNAYQNDPSTHWSEPDNVTIIVCGVEISARQWVVMTLYNGAEGTYPLPFADHANESTPIHFDPETSQWSLYNNSRNYVPRVFEDCNAQEND